MLGLLLMISLALLLGQLSLHRRIKRLELNRDNNKDEVEMIIEDAKKQLNSTKVTPGTTLIYSEEISSNSDMATIENELTDTYGQKINSAGFFVCKKQFFIAFVTMLVASLILFDQAIFGVMSTPVAYIGITLAVIYLSYTALKTNTTGLGLVAALIGLLTPYFVGLIISPIITVTYLLILTIGFLFLGFKLQAPSLTFLLTSGIFWYTFGINNFISPTVFSFFVGVFSILFLISVTVSLIRSAHSKTIDIATLIVLGLGYVNFASVIATSPSKAIFSATAFLGAIGYFLFKKNLATHVVGLYSIFIVAGILFGTSFLFSGSTLTLALIFELTTLFLLVTYFSLPKRIIWVSASLLILPLLASFFSLNNLTWKYGIWHKDALVVSVMLLSLSLATFWIIYKPGVAMFSSAKKLSGYLGVTSFIYAYIVIAVMMRALFPATDSTVMTYVFWAVLSLGVINYALQQGLSRRVLYCAIGSLLLPVLFSFKSFVSPAWENGIYHNQSFGLSAIIVIGFLVILLLTQQFCRNLDFSLRKIVGWLIFFEIFYIFASVIIFSYSLFSNSTANVVTYVIYSCVLYLLTLLFIKIHAQLIWIKITLAGLILPIFLSFDSFSFIGWERDNFLVNLVGLIAITSILTLISYSLKTQSLYVKTKSNKSAFILFTNISPVLLTAYLIAILWSVTQTIFI